MQEVLSSSAVINHFSHRLKQSSAEVVSVFTRRLKLRGVFLRKCMVIYVPYKSKAVHKVREMGSDRPISDTTS